MEKIVYIPVIITIILALSCFVSVRKRIKEKKYKIASVPFFVAIIGMIGAGVFNAFTIFSSAEEEEIWVPILFFAFVLLGWSLMIAYLNCVIYYDDRGFEAKYFFGYKRKGRYTEVEGVRSTSNNYRMYFNGHSVSIDKFGGGSAFIEELRRQYKKRTGHGLSVSPSYRAGWDPMNGNIENPWLYLFFAIFLAVMAAAIFAIIIYSMNVETDISELKVRNATFSDYKISGEDLILYSNEHEMPFEINYYKSYGEVFSEPQDFCEDELYELYVREGSDFYFVYSMTDKENVEYITIESERQVYVKNNIIPAYIMGVFCVGSFVFAIMGIIVARNPDKFSTKVKRMFYKDYVWR